MAQTNPYGRIWEMDGAPQDLGGGQLGWIYVVTNTSFGNITAVRFENIFSTAAPILDVGRTGWSLSATDSNSDQLWEIIVSTASNYLPAGQSDFFSFVTTYTPATHTLLTGPRPGAVKFDGDGHWYSPDVSGLIGPVGQNPLGTPTLALQAALAETADADAARPGTQWSLACAFTNTSPDGLANGGPPLALVTFTLPAGTNAGVYRVEPALGCVAWPVTLTGGQTVLDGHAQPLPAGAAGAVTLYFDAGVLATNPVTANAAGVVAELPFTPVPLPVPAPAPANPYGRIWETDGVPQDLGGGQLGWVYGVKNQSFGNITAIRLENIFSTSPPVMVFQPGSWALTATGAGQTNFWTVVVQTSDSFDYIPPNGGAELWIRTTLTPTTHRLVTGPRPGAVKFETDPNWYSPDVSGLIGPVGEVLAESPPVVPELSGLGVSSNRVSFTATNLVWGYGCTLEASSNLVTWTSLPLDSVWQTWTPAGGPGVLTLWATNFPGPIGDHPFDFAVPPAAPAQFYRLRSP